MNSHCPSCRKDKKFKLFPEIANIFETFVQVLGSCTECFKGKWLEVSKEEFDKLKK